MNFKLNHSSNFFVPPNVLSFVITSVAPSIRDKTFSQKNTNQKPSYTFTVRPILNRLFLVLKFLIFGISFSFSNWE